MDGDLTIRGVTKQVTLDATLEGVVKDPYGMHRVGFSATTSIDREDFGVSFNGVLETGGVIVSQEGRHRPRGRSHPPGLIGPRRGTRPATARTAAPWPPSGAATGASWISSSRFWSVPR